jgi:hypothetical protein
VEVLRRKAFPLRATRHRQRMRRILNGLYHLGLKSFCCEELILDQTAASTGVLIAKAISCVPYRIAEKRKELHCFNPNPEFRFVPGVLLLTKRTLKVTSVSSGRRLEL